MDRNSALKAFKREVLDMGADACLPANLPDGWIEYLDGELSALDYGSDDDAEEESPACSLAAVLSILFEKHAQESLSMTFDELYIRMAEYRIEIGLEIVCRRTEINYNPATLANIFTNRTVECWKTS
ncbi:hypothetical protein F6V25_03110 [Oryzomonas japonica]|uniref:Uncharacterized protein n=1 Tax=Oryzomonas japonica TaxID=2603858 RepID=A0A7J4ZW07_9BACT|nr:hypothetical protein [Oryzomonas japonica]KAB0667700.1 hypothetical protein F6V25_03110 [Oryzomonas japonica]